MCIDKPLAISYEEAAEIVQVCKVNNMPLMSALALRYSMPHSCGDAVFGTAFMQLRCWLH